MHPKAVGEITTAIVLAAFLKHKKSMLLPWGDSLRYDLVWDCDGKFVRIQCKTGKMYKGGVFFKTHSQHKGSNGKNCATRNYKNQADLFAIYSPIMDKIYLLPVKDVGDTGCLLRVEPTITQPARRWAKDYEIDKVLKKYSAAQ